MLDLNLAKAAKRCRCKEQSLVRDVAIATGGAGGLGDSSDPSCTHLLHHGMQSDGGKVVSPQHHVQHLAVPAREKIFKELKYNKKM